MEIVIGNLGANAKFTHDILVEAAEHEVVEAKLEIEAHIMNIAQQKGLTAIESTQVPRLEDVDNTRCSLNHSQE
jgi:hypothetical protein